jgi:hypothetical protein
VQQPSEGTLQFILAYFCPNQPSKVVVVVGANCNLNISLKHTTGNIHSTKFVILAYMVIHEHILEINPVKLSFSAMPE